VAAIEQVLSEALNAEAEQLYPATVSVRPVPTPVSVRRAMVAGVAAALLVVAAVGAVGLLRWTGGSPTPADESPAVATTMAGGSPLDVEFPVPGTGPIPPGSIEVPLAPMTSATPDELDWLEAVASSDRIVAVGEVDDRRIYALVGSDLLDANGSSDGLCLVTFVTGAEPDTACGDGPGLIFEVLDGSPDARAGTVGVVGGVEPGVTYVTLSIGGVTYAQRPNAGFVYLVRSAGPGDSVSWATFTADDRLLSGGSIATPDPAVTTTNAADQQPGVQAYACGSELPFEVDLPEDFSGPFDGASPDSIAAAENGQLVVHWTGRGGSVELRWPGDTAHLAGVTWGELPPDLSDNTIFLLEWTPIVDGVAQEPVVDAFGFLPSDEMEGPCDAVQLKVYTGGGAGEEVSAGFGPGSGDELGITVHPSLPRPRDLILIVDTLSVDEIPPVVACEGGAPNRPPNQTRSIEDGPSFATAREALQGILATPDAETWPKTGYFELILDNGSIVYGNPLDNLSANPLPDTGLVIAVTVQQTETGWTATGWETSGC
jgi:hypothetical protein